MTRQGHRRRPGEIPASGVSEIPAPTRRRVPRRYPVTSDHGQLWDAQARESKGVAATSSSVRLSLPSYPFQLDASCRAMVRPPGQPGYPPRRLPQPSRSAGGHRDLSPGVEPGPPTLRVDRDHRIYPAKAHALSPNFGADPVRLHQPSVQKAKAKDKSWHDCLVISRTLH
jgi:hypothetical protein